MSTSTHKVEVVPVVLEKHPNADTLSIVNVWGYSCCVRSEDWAGVERAAYIPPDSIVDSNRPEFAFLAGHERIKVKKLRGVVSMGLLVPAPEGSAIGDDVANQLGVTHYEPPIHCVGGEATKPPSGYRPNYDVETAYRYPHIFVNGEPVWVTEKIHGANARFCFDGEKMHCGSRVEWKVERDDVLWWRALRVCPWLESFCRANPDITVYGEVFGQVQDLKYGRSVDVAVFDLLRGTTWLDPLPARELGASLQWVPLIGTVAWTWPEVAAFAEGPSRVTGADHLREGIVVKPMHERTHPEVGRVQVKIVSSAYLAR